MSRLDPSLPWLTLGYKGAEWFVHAVLVPNWAENLFDDLKHQRGWTGLSTQDLMARMVG